MRLGNFTAHIIVDGKPLDEYDVASESSTEAKCWIASEEGKLFGVQWRCLEESRLVCSAGEVSVDGINCGYAVIALGTLGNGDTAIHSYFVGDTTKRDLVFTQIQLTDDDSLLTKEIPKHFGQIRLTIRRGQIVMHPFPISGNQSMVPSDNTFHERSKKATVHCIGKVLNSFGPERARNVSPYQARLVPNDEPALTFVFNYQPLSILQANGISPRSGVNKDISEDIKPSELDDRIRSLENELKRLRDLKVSNSEERKPKRIKREEKPAERKRRPRVSSPGEIIDRN